MTTMTITPTARSPTIPRSGVVPEEPVGQPVPVRRQVCCDWADATDSGWP